MGASALRLGIAAVRLAALAGGRRDARRHAAAGIAGVAVIQLT